MDRQMFGSSILSALSGLLVFLEELVNTLSGPLLVLGLGIALVDLLTDGALTVHVPALLYVWAISQAAGVDAQLVGSFARARHALRTGRRLPLVGLLVLGVMLAYVGWIAAEVFATEQAQHITTAAALQLLGMNPTTWIIQRTALSVFLVALSGWTRYHAPPKDEAAQAENERARLERELELEPLRQQARAQKALGGVTLVRQTIAAARGKPAETVPDHQPPTGPGTPLAAPVVRTQDDGQAGKAPAVLRLEPPPEWNERPRRTAQGRAGKGTHRRRVRTGRPGATATVEAKARAAYTPGMSVRQLEVAAGISHSAAGKFRRVFRAEEDERAASSEQQRAAM